MDARVASQGAESGVDDSGASLVDAAGGTSDASSGDAGSMGQDSNVLAGMWAIMAAPLIAGNDVRSMSSETRETLTNAEIIAVDQDPLGQQGRLVASPDSNLQVWSKTLVGRNVRAVALFNRGTTPAAITVLWSHLGLPVGAATVRDLWTHTDLGNFSASYTATKVPAHGIAMLRVTSVP